MSNERLDIVVPPPIAAAVSEELKRKIQRMKSVGEAGP